MNLLKSFLRGAALVVLLIVFLILRPQGLLGRKGFE